MLFTHFKRLAGKIAKAIFSAQNGMKSQDVGVCAEKDKTKCSIVQGGYITMLT